MEKASTACNVRVKRCSTLVNISHESSDEEQKQNASHSRAGKERTSSQGSVKNPDLLCPSKRSSHSDNQCSNADTSNLLNACSFSKMQCQNNGAVEAPDSPVDDTSCISGLDAINMTVQNSSNDAERKNSGSGSSASIDSFSSSGKAFSDPQNILDKTSTNSEESVNNPCGESSKSPPLSEPLPKQESSVCPKEKGTLLSTTMPFREESEISEHSETKEGKEKQVLSMDKTCTAELHLASQSADIINSSELADEVRVCDICGDVGRENLLAICTKCNDGAEHIYCMRVKMDKVPAGDWVCEDCKINQESEKEREKKVQEVDELLKRAHSIKMSQSHVSFGPSNLKERLKVDIGPSGLEKKTTDAVSCSPKLPSKISSVNLEALPMTKKIILGTHDESPKRVHPQKMLLLSGSSSSPRKTSEGKVKPFPSSGLSRTTFSAGKSRLLKSNSFNIGDNQVKDCQLQQGSERSVVSKDHGKGGHNKIFCKSLSFKDARTEFSVPDIPKDKKMLSPKSPLVKDQIRVRRTEDCFSQQKSLPKFGSLNGDDKRSARSGELLQKPLTVANHQGQETTHGHAHLSNSSNLKLRRCPPQKCSGDPREENYRIINHMKAESDGKDMDLDANMFSKRNYLDNFIPSQEGVIPQADFIWKGGFEVLRSEGLTNSFPCIQAHKSIRASDKVDAIMAKSPQKIILDEVPRFSIWSTQFKDSQAVEDNIALFFFAENIESYEAYKGLLMHISVNDLALKGYLEGVELLIFSSKVLPPGSQRWNNLLYLWGVLRITGVSLPENELTSQNQRYSPGCNTNCTSLLPSNSNAFPPASPRRVSEISEPAASSPGLKSFPLQGIDHQHSNSSKPYLLVGGRDSYGLDLQFRRDNSTRYLSLGASSDEERPNRKMKGILDEPSEPCSWLSKFLEAGPVFGGNDFLSTSAPEDIKNAAVRILRDDEHSALEDVDLELSLGPPINRLEKRKALNLSSEEVDDGTWPMKRLQRDVDELSLSLSLTLSLPL